MGEDSSVSVVTRLRSRRRWCYVSIPDCGKKIFASRMHPHRLWFPSSCNSVWPTLQIHDNMINDSLLCWSTLRSKKFNAANYNKAVCVKVNNNTCYRVLRAGARPRRGGERGAAGLHPPISQLKWTDLVDTMISNVSYGLPSDEISHWNRLMTTISEFWKIKYKT